MKTKFYVTVEADVTLVSQIDDIFARDILTKSSHSNRFFGKKYLTMKADDEKIQLSKGKWFNKFKTIKLINIEKSFMLESSPELILLYISLKSFKGYIVLRIHISGNMMDFTDLLKKVHAHEHIVLVKGNIYYEPPSDLIDAPSPNHMSYSQEPLSELNTSNGLDPLSKTTKSFRSESPLKIDQVLNDKYSSNETSNKCQKIYRVENGSDEFTFINNNSEEFINDKGPIALFSQTFPSTYGKHLENYHSTVDEVESESESESDKDSGNDTRDYMNY